METFFDILLVIMMGISLSVNIAMSKKIASIDKRNDLMQRKIIHMLHTHSVYFERLEESLDNVSDTVVKEACNTQCHSGQLFEQILERLNSATPITPIKPNNWDSVREAFKGPARVDIDVRN